MDAADDVRVVLLKSSGRVFCSGADLSEASTVPMQEGARAIVGVQRQIVALSKPVVTVVEGAARAGGIGIVAASDVVVVADDATFALTEVKLGLTPGGHLADGLPRLTPRGLALDRPGRRGVHGYGGRDLRPRHLRRTRGPSCQAKVDEVVGQIATGAAQGLRETKQRWSPTCSSGSTPRARSSSSSAPGCSGRTRPARR